MAVAWFFNGQLDDVRIQAELERAAGMLDEKLKADQAAVVDRLVRQAFTDITDVFDQTARGDWVLKSNKLLDPCTAAAVLKVIITPKGEVRVDLTARDAALAALARHLGLFKQQVTLTNPDGSPLLPSDWETLAWASLRAKAQIHCGAIHTAGSLSGLLIVNDLSAPDSSACRD
jgi:Terminase small subunit